MTYPDNMMLRPLAAWTGPVTAQRRRSPFSTLFSDTLTQLGRELRHLGGGRPAPSVLQLALREQDFRLTDGMPRANSRPSHPGVILSIEPTNGGPLSFPCDTFTDWRDNLRAITLTLTALRQIDRYGVTQTGEQYTGWRAIEAKPTVDVVAAACSTLAHIAWPNENRANREEWAPKIATDSDIGRNTLRKARRNAHPDRNGGDQTLWNEVESAAAALRAAGVRWIR